MTTVSLFWFAAYRWLPDGSRPKKRGVLPCVGSQPMVVSTPVDLSMAKIAMLSCPRFDPYTNRPDGATAISDVVLLPGKLGGSVVMTWSGCSSPDDESK